MAVLLKHVIWPALMSTLTWFLFTAFLSHAVQSDVDCLRSIRDSFEDPENNVFRTWNFSSGTEGYICHFTGIQCWHEEENRVLNIRLSSMGLRGEFPMGITGCSSMTGLDLSGNNISGMIPNNISHMISYVTILDLSSNQFSGAIPMDIANCTYLNSLRLDNNQLTGQIPLQIGQLSRLTAFSVVGNRLSGQVPRFINPNPSIGRDSYAGNPGLCGSPLPVCRVPSSRGRIPVFIGTAVAGVVVGALALAIGMFFYMRKMSMMKEKDKDPLCNKWAKSIKGAKRIKLAMFEKSVSKMNLRDLMKATKDFSKENIIGTGRTGTMYKATLDDGTSLLVKRLQDTKHLEKEFMSEMTTLGNIKHRNLVPLLGFCMTKKERFLVYKFMSKGTLHDKLHLLDEGAKSLDWPLRLKIGIGAAKGFAWLHHNCNPRIIHRNISSKCILLDTGYEPKISDFGLARLMNPVDTHLSTFVNGEFGDLGYVAPEYARTLVATPKGDVYSFGVVLLELVTGEKPTYVTKAPDSFKGSLVDWISQLSSESKLHDAIDIALVGKGYDSEVFQFLKVACSCVLPASHKERPSMFEVYQLLRAIGQCYGFTTEDDIMVLLDSGNADHHVELIVARDVLEIE